MAKKTKRTYLGTDALRSIPKDSPLQQLNVHKSGSDADLEKAAYTGEHNINDQEVVVLSTDDVFNQKESPKKNLFGLTAYLRAKKYDILSAEPELDDILDRMIDECIVFNSDSNFFCEPDFCDIDKLEIDDTTKQTIKDDFMDAFEQVYLMYAFNGLNSEPRKQDVRALLREYLVRGRLGYEIVFDNADEPTDVVGIRKLNAFALTPMKKGDMFFWQYDKSQQDMFKTHTMFDVKAPAFVSNNSEKINLLDSQVAYLQWNDDMVGSMSYFERLVRAFNLLRILERSRIAYATTASRFRSLITIPTGGKLKAAAQETLRKAMNKYHEKIEFDNQTGELQVNGEASVPFNSEFWMADTNAGKPNIQTIGTGMPDLSDTSAVTYFRNNLQRLSKLPLSRFDDGGGMWNVSEESIQRDERRFAIFISALMRRFGVAIILKPVYVLMCIKNNNYIGDNEILNALKLKFNRYNHFQTQMELTLLQKRIHTIEDIRSSLVRSLNMSDTERPFFSSNWLINKYLGLSKEDMQANAEQLDIELQENLKLAMEAARLVAIQTKQAQQQLEQQGVANDVSLAAASGIDDVDDEPVDDEPIDDEPAKTSQI